MSLFGWIGKHPLETLLAGAAIAGTGGAAAPAVLGAEAAGGAAAGGLLAGGSTLGAAGGLGMAAAPGAGMSLAAGSGTGLTAGMGSGLGLASTSAPGLSATTAALTPEASFGSQLLGGIKTAGSYAKPVMEASMAANSINGLLGGGQQPAQGHAPQTVGGGQSLSQLYTSLQQGDMQAQQDEVQKRMKQQELLKRFGGANGWSA